MNFRVFVLSLTASLVVSMTWAQTDSLSRLFKEFDAVFRDTTADTLQVYSYDPYVDQDTTLDSLVHVLNRRYYGHRLVPHLEHLVENPDEKDYSVLDYYAVAKIQLGPKLTGYLVREQDAGELALNRIGAINLYVLEKGKTAFSDTVLLAYKGSDEGWSNHTETRICDIDQDGKKDLIIRRNTEDYDIKEDRLLIYRWNGADFERYWTGVAAKMRVEWFPFFDSAKGR